MMTSDKVSTYFDRKAASWDAIYSGEKNTIFRWWDTLTRQNIHSRFDFALNTLSPLDGKIILDVGCGSGRYCLELAAGGAREVVGIDVSLKMVELSRQLAEREGMSDRCSFLQRNVTDLQGSFDDTIALGFFDYISQPEEVLRHLRSLTRGKLVASFPALWSLRVPFRKIWLSRQGCPVYFYTKKDISLLCQKAGFVPTTLIKRGPIYLLAAQPSSES